jgi:DNA-binding transcriptional LysR family regulator
VEEGIELALRIGKLKASTLVARRLGTVQHYLVATPTYLHGRPMPRTPDDLNTHQCIIYSRLPAANEWTFESEHGRHVTSIGGPVIVDDADAMEEAVMHHLGIAILPEWNAVDGIRSGQLENILPEYSIAPSPLHAVYPEMHWMSPRARSFLDLLIKRADQFAPQPMQPRRHPA